VKIVDILIIVLLIIYLFKGLKNGAIKELVTFIGGILVLVIAFALKNPVSVFLYQKLPFFNFDGIFSGISVLSIVIYELIAFLGVAAILLIIYTLIIRVTNILETILKVTVILEIPSKILGALIGLIEGLVVSFVILFIMMQFNVTKKFIDESKYGDMVLTKTPILSNITSEVYNSLDEIYTLAENYKDRTDRDAVNLEALEILLKYKVITPENADALVDEGKLTMGGAKEVIAKYY